MAARSLALTSPRERGSDVLSLQTVLNDRLHAQGFPMIAADGEYGPATDHAVARVKFLLGWPEKQLHTAVGIGQFKWLANPDTRPQAFKQRSKSRNAVIAHRRKTAAHALAHGPAAAIVYAKGHVGIHEAGDSNWGGQVTNWLKAVDCGPAPWCGAFAHACLADAGVKGLSYRMRYVPYIIEDGHAGRNGLLRVVGFGEARAGDLICFDWQRDGVADHVALYLGLGVTIEGNTTRDASAPPEQQSNGGEVCVRRRGIGSAAGWTAVVRPHYV